MLVPSLWLLRTWTESLCEVETSQFPDAWVFRSKYQLLRFVTCVLPHRIGLIHLHIASIVTNVMATRNIARRNSHQGDSLLSNKSWESYNLPHATADFGYCDIYSVNIFFFLFKNPQCLRFYKSKVWQWEGLRMSGIDMVMRYYRPKPTKRSWQGDSIRRDYRPPAWWKKEWERNKRMVGTRYRKVCANCQAPMVVYC